MSRYLCPNTFSLFHPTDRYKSLCKGCTGQQWKWKKYKKVRDGRHKRDGIQKKSLQKKGMMVKRTEMRSSMMRSEVGSSETIICSCYLFWETQK